VNNPGSSAPPLHDEHLQAALPALQALDERLAQVLLPSIMAGAPTALAGGFWQLAKGLHFLVEVLEADTESGQASHLGGAGEALDSAAGDLRQARADLMHLQDLAAEELEQRMNSVELESDAIANAADLEVSLPHGRPARIQISIDHSTGRAAWSSPDVDLAPIGGRRQLDLTAGLRMLAETITYALPASLDQAGS
jgi:hypothetical protein